jgi:hypothetical protein
MEQDGLLLGLADITSRNSEGLPSFAPARGSTARSSGAQVRLPELRLLNTKHQPDCVFL